MESNGNSTVVTWQQTNRGGREGCVRKSDGSNRKIDHECWTEKTANVSQAVFHCSLTPNTLVVMLMGVLRELYVEQK